jgi:hypothetical protein
MSGPRRLQSRITTGVVKDVAKIDIPGAIVRRVGIRQILCEYFRPPGT